MIDIVLPNNNEKEFIQIAEKLGYKELLFLYHYFEGKILESNKIKTALGLTLDQKDINRIKDGKTFIAVRGVSNMHALEKSRINLVFSLEESSKKDFIHHRASGLNQVSCKILQKNNIYVGLSLSSILNSKNKATILGRIAQNIKLCRKYKLKTIIASFAHDPYQMRSPYDIVSLFLTLGMHPKEIKNSMEFDVKIKQ